MAGLGDCEQGLIGTESPRVERPVHDLVVGCGKDAAGFAAHEVSVGLYLRLDK